VNQHVTRYRKNTLFPLKQAGLKIEDSEYWFQWTFPVKLFERLIRVLLASRQSRNSSGIRQSHSVCSVPSSTRSWAGCIFPLEQLFLPGAVSSSMRSGYRRMAISSAARFVLLVETDRRAALDNPSGSRRVDWKGRKMSVSVKTAAEESRID
jgi:hypothetical protein